MINDEELAKWEALANGVDMPWSRAPWYAEHNAAFIAEARTAVPELIEEVRRLQSKVQWHEKEREQLRDALYRNTGQRKPEDCGYETANQIFIWRDAWDAEKKLRKEQEDEVRRLRELHTDCVNENRRLYRELDALRAPIPMLLACPVCHTTHLDQGEWETRPHKTHQCQGCLHEWRPANVSTVGVAALRGSK